MPVAGMSMARKARARATRQPFIGAALLSRKSLKAGFQQPPCERQARRPASKSWDVASVTKATDYRRAKWISHFWPTGRPACGTRHGRDLPSDFSILAQVSASVTERLKIRRSGWESLLSTQK